MTRMTQNNQVAQFIILMASIFMMDMKILYRLAQKTMIRKEVKGSLSIISTSLSIILVVFACTFKGMKNFLLALVRTIFRRIYPTTFSFVFKPTLFTLLCNFSALFFRPRYETFSTAIRNHLRFSLSYITWPFKKGLSAIFANNFNFCVPGTFITHSRTVRGIISFECNLANWTCFHASSLPLETVKKQPKTGEQP